MFPLFVLPDFSPAVRIHRQVIIGTRTRAIQYELRAPGSVDPFAEGRVHAVHSTEEGAVP